MRELTPDQQYAVTTAWSLRSSPPDVLQAAWESAGVCDAWDKAEAVALSAGASEEDASMLADAVDVAQSPNMTREAWICAVAGICNQIDALWCRAASWMLSDADVIPDPHLGIRMAVEAARVALHGAGGLRHLLAEQMTSELYASARPDEALVRHATGSLAGFSHRGRWYLYPPSTSETPSRWTALLPTGSP